MRSCRHRHRSEAFRRPSEVPSSPEIRRSLARPTSRLQRTALHTLPAIKNQAFCRGLARSPADFHISGRLLNVSVSRNRRILTKAEMKRALRRVGTGLVVQLTGMRKRTFCHEVGRARAASALAAAPRSVSFDRRSRSRARPRPKLVPSRCLYLCPHNGPRAGLRHRARPSKS